MLRNRVQPPPIQIELAVFGRSGLHHDFRPVAFEVLLHLPRPSQDTAIEVHHGFWDRNSIREIRRGSSRKFAASNPTPLKARNDRCISPIPSFSRGGPKMDWIVSATLRLHSAAIYFISAGVIPRTGMRARDMSASPSPISVVQDGKWEQSLVLR